MNSEIHIRPLKPTETYFLSEMLYAAIYIPDSGQPLPKEVINEPELAKYISNFGRKGDICLMAELKGKLIGAVWTRIFADDDAGYGFVNAQTPELGMAIDKYYRNMGIGTRLLAAILQNLAELNYKQVSLSVDSRNFAHQLYQKFGFADIAVKGYSVTMVSNLNQYKNDKRNNISTEKQANELAD